MTLYLLLDLLVLAGPTALSFDRRVAFVRSWPAVLAAAVVVGGPFIVWDSLATAAGVWSFNPATAGPPVLFDLPLGELLFFLVVPFSCLFVYEVVRAYLPMKVIRFPRWLGFALALAAVGGAFLTYPRAYTAVVLAATAFFLTVATLLRPRLLRERTTWLALLVSFIPFGIVNGILTAVPVVLYNPQDILGPRVGSIPIEDFLYSFAMIGLSILVYDVLRRPLTAKKGTR